MSLPAQVICPKCGSVYERRSEKVIFRDSDARKCDVCDQVLDRWNGSRIPTFKLLKRGHAPTSRTVADDGADYVIRSCYRDGKHVVEVLRGARVVREYAVSGETAADAQASGAALDPIAEQMSVAEDDVRRGLGDEIKDADTDPDPNATA
jgi:hypothetical protein